MKKKIPTRMNELGLQKHTGEKERKCSPLPVQWIKVLHELRSIRTLIIKWSREAESRNTLMRIWRGYLNHRYKSSKKKSIPPTLFVNLLLQQYKTHLQMVKQALNE